MSSVKNIQFEYIEKYLSNTHCSQLALRISNICCSISPSHAISVEVYSWALMSRSRKKTYSASLSWHRLKTFLSLTSELHHWYRVADPVLQSRHQKEDKYQVNAFQRLSTLKTNKFITACFSVCSICKCSFSESALCTPKSYKSCWARQALTVKDIKTHLLKDT